jgi:hypothetical protein
MTAADSTNIQEEFIEAKNHWELEKLYVDLASAKGKSLTPVEKKFLRGLLCGCSPSEIANAVYKSSNSSTVRVYLSNGLYKYIEQMLSTQEGYPVRVKSWSRVTFLLENAGYKKARVLPEQLNNQIAINNHSQNNVMNIKSTQGEDWGEAIDVTSFYGRTTELTLLEEWIVQEHCRLVVILGMGGIGKTAFSVKVAEKIKNHFEYIIWRSLRLAPPVDVILNQLIQILSQNVDMTAAETLEHQISQLIECLRRSRCLIVLDHVDSVLCSDYGDALYNHNDTSTHLLPQISYRIGYEGYGELIRRVADSQHQSCLLLTSREKPQEISANEGKKLFVRSLKLNGLSHPESQKILLTKGLTKSTDSENKQLIEWYSGNPLFIKLAGTAIQELFGGSINDFLQKGSLLIRDIKAVLHQQFHRLSSLEKLTIYSLALNQNLMRELQVTKDIVPQVSPWLIWEAIELLQRRSLIERQASKFCLTPVWIEYIAQKIIEENFKLSQEKAGSLLISHTIFEEQVKNYIREIRHRQQ